MTVEIVAELLWNRFSPEHEVVWPSQNADEYRRAAKDIINALSAALASNKPVGDGYVLVPIDEAAKVCARLEYDASWDKCGHGYYRLKQALAASGESGR